VSQVGLLLVQLVFKQQTIHKGAMMMSFLSGTMMIHNHVVLDSFVHKLLLA
jgi:hypothetical protein